MAHFALVTRSTTNDRTGVTRSMLNVMSASTVGGNGYKTESSARAAMKRMYGETKHYIIVEFASYEEAVKYARKTEAEINA